MNTTTKLPADASRSGRLVRGSIGLGLLIFAVATQRPSWWDLAGGIVVLPAVSAGIALLAMVVLRRTVSDSGPRDGWSPIQIAAAGAILVSVLGIGTALTFLTPLDAGTLYLFIGVSMVVAGLKGYRGCEILALPNLVLGRREAIWCPLFAPIDRVGTRENHQRSGS